MTTGNPPVFIGLFLHNKMGGGGGGRGWLAEFSALAVPVQSWTVMSTSKSIIQEDRSIVCVNNVRLVHKLPFSDE